MTHALLRAVLEFGRELLCAIASRLRERPFASRHIRVGQQVQHPTPSGSSSILLARSDAGRERPAFISRMH